MPRGKRAVGFAGTVIAVSMLLSGCAGATTTRPSDTPVTTPTPAFTSDADATAAAIAFYKKYLKVASAIAESDTRSTADLRPLLSEDQYKSEVADIAALRGAGHHLGGPVKLKRLEVQSLDRVGGAMSAYVCLSAKDAPIVDSAGKPVSTRGQGSGSTLVVKFLNLGTNPQIKSSETWSGESIC